jgi:hypothetical protein
MALTRRDLWSLEEYAEKRQAFRAEVLAHKKNRQVNLSPNARLIFEDELTIRYQIQEMLRIEKVFEAAGIQEELDAYNPLIPDGSNWKATFLLEYEDVEDRREALEKLIGVEDQVWMRVAGHDKVYAIADEDMDRENDTKTSSVHFVRFEMSDAMAAAALQGAGIECGCDHPELAVDGLKLPDAIAAALRKDLR